ncbi:MAG TPA: hypothetical protein PLZ82_11760 [Smithellaceae bacterium]|nr:hypothetical protein [Smithella sp.]HQH06070.1 hypothetical protein [Smithellaceae bacterium]
MTRVIIETSDQWLADRIGVMLQNEAYILRKTVQNVRSKIRSFEEKYGLSETMSLLYGKVDDMDLIEWEGELETLARLEKKLVALEGVHVETE